MTVRIAKMDRAELLDRCRQEIRKRLDLASYRLGFDRSSAELCLDRARGGRFFFGSGEVPGLADLLRERLPQAVEHIVQQAEKICRHRFDLLGYEGVDYGKPIDWHCDRVHGKRAPRKPWFKIRYLDFAEVGDAKVTWELNRHQHLVTLAKAYQLTRDHRFASELLDQWRHWHKENPYPIGINWASSLEVAFRSMSWLWMYFLLEDTLALTPGFREQWLRALGISGRHIERYLSTFFSPNTHLLGEGVALLFLGTCVPELRSAERWRRLGWQIVSRAAQYQVQDDGLHFEQSVYYHVYAVDFFIHAGVLASINDAAFPQEYDRRLEKMLDALCVLCRAGAPPRLGDDDGGRVFAPRRNRAEHLADPLATGAVLFGRRDFKHAAGGLREETLWLLGEQGVKEFDRLPATAPSQVSTALSAGGLYVMASPALGQQLVIDSGPQGSLAAGHGHADALAVTMNNESRPLLIDPGTLVYVGANANTERNQFRCTSAHNTLVVDGISQSEPRGPFAWKQLPSVKAERWISGKNFDLFVGSHNGYCRGESPVVHRRWVFFLKSQFWLIRDSALGSGQHRLDLYWHLSPTLSPKDSASDIFLEAGTDRGLRVLVADGSWSRDIQQGWWSPAYGQKEASRVLHFNTATALPAEFVTLFAPVVAEQVRNSGPAQIRRLLATDAVTVYRYTQTGDEHTLFFGRKGPWKMDGWSSDAEFLYLGANQERKLLICCNGTYVEAGGKKVFSSSKTVLRCEVVSSGGNTEVLSSDKEVVVAQDQIDSLAVESAPIALASIPEKTGG